MNWKKIQLLKYIDPNTGLVKEIKWKCKKCGLERSNKITHKHRVPMEEMI